MSVLITRENLLEALELAVKDRGEDWTYPPIQYHLEPKFDPGLPKEDDWHFEGGLCRYHKPQGTPACIFGWALDRIDLTILAPYDDVPKGISNILRENFIEHEADDRPLIRAASEAQSYQDQGSTWGEVLDRFKRILTGDAS